ncbi:MAG: HPr(Ser) kinase/phosphatase [Chlamydiales bacterium]
MYRVENLYNNNRKKLGLELCTGQDGLKRKICVPEAERPGLSLSGYLNPHTEGRILIFGEEELAYLDDIGEKESASRINAILSTKTPAVIVTRYSDPPQTLYVLCKERKIPLFRAKMDAVELLRKISFLLIDAFAPSQSCHGSLVEVFGVGVLIQGESSVGKSEAALGLIERGHRLISDDIVKVKRREEGFLEGSGVNISHNHMEVRGIGMINVINLFGVDCVREKKSLDIVVKLEVWDDNRFYDRLRDEETTINILGIEVPYRVLRINPGRDVVLLIETISLIHRLKAMGRQPAEEFNIKLLSAITHKSRKR